MELLGNGVLDLDSLDHLVERFALAFPAPELVLNTFLKVCCDHARLHRGELRTILREGR